MTLLKKVFFIFLAVMAGSRADLSAGRLGFDWVEPFEDPSGTKWRTTYYSPRDVCLSFPGLEFLSKTGNPLRYYALRPEGGDVSSIKEFLVLQYQDRTLKIGARLIDGALQKLPPSEGTPSFEDALKEKGSRCFKGVFYAPSFKGTPNKNTLEFLEVFVAYHLISTELKEHVLARAAQLGSNDYYGFGNAIEVVSDAMGFIK